MPFETENSRTFDDVRRAMIETEVPESDLLLAMADNEPVWDTAALKQDFEVLAFAAPFVIVKRRSDGVRGSLEFTHDPRCYFGFSAS